mmetsp:Transcript_40852/g.60110  ORF Transcript_40852/g.60110 Transcript_40852/m.60110 type:complete len:215 (-) Transcript_40852:61-705(-)
MSSAPRPTLMAPVRSERAARTREILAMLRAWAATSPRCPEISTLSRRRSRAPCACPARSRTHARLATHVIKPSAQNSTSSAALPSSVPPASLCPAAAEGVRSAERQCWMASCSGGIARSTAPASECMSARQLRARASCRTSWRFRKWWRTCSMASVGAPGGMSHSDGPLSVPASRRMRSSVACPRTCTSSQCMGIATCSHTRRYAVINVQAPRR